MFNQIKLENLLQTKWNLEVEEKIKGQKTRLQTDQEFKQEVFELNKKYNVDMFSTAARGGKSFAAKKKLGQLKKRIFTLKAIEKKFSTDKRTRPYEIIKKLVENMINLPNAKYKQVQNDVEKNVLRYDPSRERFNFVRLEKINREKYRLERFDKKNLPEKKAQVKTFASSGRRSAGARL